MPSSATVCLVSPSHLSNNPRLVKEAHALHAAGYTVEVVCGRYFPPIDAHDTAISSAAPWRTTVVDYGSGLRARLLNLRHKLARRTVLRTAHPSLTLAQRAQHRAAPLLAAAAARRRADLFIGHLPAGLVAAAHAAQYHRTRYGFDAEDFHAAETDAVLRDPTAARALAIVERTLLGGCAHLTAASPLIGQAFVDTYGIRPLLTVLNVFPRAEAPSSLTIPPPPPAPQKLYWFSQTIGPGRGLEALVSVLGCTRTPCELHLRGLPAAGYPEHLTQLARSTNVRAALTFHSLAAAAEMARLAQGHALGLSLEQSTPSNRDLCLTNKIFTYLLAGVPVALTPTSAQRALAPELGAAALLLDLSAPDACASQLDTFFSDIPRRRLAHETAWRLAQTRFNWDEAQQPFLASVALALQR